MQNLFNSEEFDAEEEPETSTAATVASDIIASLQPSAPAAEVAVDVESDNYMALVDQRLEVAQYYRLLLGAPLFDQDTLASRIVEREHRAFIRERLEILLSIRQEVKSVPVEVKSPFSEEEVAGLKVLIGQMRAKGMIEAAKPAPEPPAPRNVAQVVATPAPLQPAKPVPAVARRRAPVKAPEAAPILPPPVAAPSTAPSAPESKRRGRPPLTQTKTVEDPETGLPREIKVSRIQRPAGALPFPADMSMATSIAASNHSAGGGSLASLIAQELKS